MPESQTGTGPRSVRTRATQQEVNNRQASKASSHLQASPDLLPELYLLSDQQWHLILILVQTLL